MAGAAHCQAPPAAALAASPVWVKLGHYESVGAGRWRSAVHPGEFFLSAQGHTDPLGELQASLAAMNAPPAADADQHAQCRFPARLLWLRRELGGTVAFRTDIQCPKYQEWTRTGGIESVSVVLATGFLGNPASYYGHMLLKFNYRDSPGAAGLMDESASYGAILDGRRDNPFVYIVRSVLHGYDAGFSNIRFYFHDHNYGNHELRDLWEYRLALSDADRDMVVAHTWEVLGRRYTYQFFQGNCALRMAEVVQTAEGVDFVGGWRPWIIPQALIRKLAEARYQGHPLVEEVIYHPSRQSRFYEKYQALPAAARRLVHDLLAEQATLEDARFQSLALPMQHAVLDTLIDYRQFVNNPIDEAAPGVQQQYAAALAMRFELPPGESAPPQKVPQSPDRAHAPGWAQGSWAHNGATGNMQSLRIRATYYDALDFGSGHVRFGSLAMGDLQLDLLDDRLRVGKFELVRIESVNPGISGLPGDRGSSWKLVIGADQARLACEDCLVARAQVDAGYTRRLLPRLSGGAFIGGALQTERAGQGLGFARASTALTLELGSAVRARVGYEFRVPVEANQRSGYGVAQAEVRYAFSEHIDLRLRYDHDRIDQVGAGLGFYW